MSALLVSCVEVSGSRGRSKRTRATVQLANNRLPTAPLRIWLLTAPRRYPPLSQVSLYISVNSDTWYDTHLHDISWPVKANITTFVTETRLARDDDPVCNVEYCSAVWWSCGTRSLQYDSVQQDVHVWNPNVSYIIQVVYITLWALLFQYIIHNATDTTHNFPLMRMLSILDWL